MAKLTQRTLELIKPEKSGQTIYDDGCLSGDVRTRKGGCVSISFYFSYRFCGKHKSYSCGTWPRCSLADIRENRDRAKEMVAQGRDPATEKKISRQAEIDAAFARLAEIEQQKAKALTVRDMFEAWLEDGVRRRDGNAELQRSFAADVLPLIGSRPIKDLTETDLRRVLRRIVARGANRAAVVLRNNLMQMTTWAEKRQPWRRLLADGNPVALIEIEKIVSIGYDMRNERSRILSLGEIRELHEIFKRMQEEYDTASDKRIVPQPLEKRVQHAIWIMLSTLCRVGELSMARWEHVNFDKREWLIPRENTKERANDFLVLLSDFSLQQFRALHELTGKSEWCFPAMRRKGHVCVKSMTKQIGDRQAMFKKAKDGKPRQPMANRRHDNTLVLGGGKGGDWVPHDLRRTGATLMQELGGDLVHIDRCQNHVLPGSKVRRHYLLYQYAAEKREAWRLLGEYLTSILSSAASLNARL